MSTSPAAWRAPAWAVVPAIVWAVIVIPYVAVGPPDFEEYFTGVASTQVAMNAIAHGAWPFWSLDFGLGAPQPLRYHFIFRRYILVTQWYYPEWMVTEGRASIHRAAEQLIGVEVAPGERSVTIQYRPYLRAALFAMGIATEVIVGIAIAVLANATANDNSPFGARNDHGVINGSRGTCRGRKRPSASVSCPP